MFFSRNEIVLSGTSSRTTWHLRLQISIGVEHGLLIAELQFSQRIQLKRKAKITTYVHNVLKSQKKSHSTLRAKRATFAKVGKS